MTQPHLPLFPSEKQIGEAVLGDRAKEWPSIARYLEDKFGLRKPHPMFGRRYWPHVVAIIEAYLQGGRRQESGQGTFFIIGPQAEDGVEIYEPSAASLRYYASRTPEAKEAREANKAEAARKRAERAARRLQTP